MILFCVCLAHAGQRGVGSPAAAGVAFQNGYTLTGKVLSAVDNIPLEGATVGIQNKQTKVLTNADGVFRIFASDTSGVLIVSYIGYESTKINFSRKEAGPLTILLERNGNQLEEVEVSTGYQTLPKERATGSFVQIDKELLNRRVSTNILDRLDGMAPGVFFNNSNTGDIARTPLFKNTGINIRGESTLHSSTDPLIVVDNFPYEGELSNINPNDVESITILKDAAAASIWGARAGNGVIVITTNKGKKGEKLTINAAANASIVDKPNLYYDPFFISSRDYIDLEKYLFAQGYFDNDLNDTRSWPAVSPVVDLLAKHRDGEIVQPFLEQKLAEWGAYDVRDQYKRYVYRKALNQQYYVGLNGGSDKVSYSFSVGHDDNRNSLIGNYFQRTSLNANQTYQITDKLSVSTTLNYSLNNTTTNNDFSYGSYTAMGGRYNRIYPYAQLVDQAGNPAALERSLRNEYLESWQARGGADWRYRPLEEVFLNDKTAKVNNLLLRVAANYQILPELRAEVSYQNERQDIIDRNLRHENSFYVRDLVNRFARQPVGDENWAYVFPLGAVLTTENQRWVSQNGRGQLNYEGLYGDHRVNAIAGLELRELQTEGYANNFYGYNDQFGTASNLLDYLTFYATNPAGSARLPAPAGGVNGQLNRYISYYANVGYTFKNRYTLNISGRKDGANLFGAKRNERVTPLWSAGLGWNISDEPFYALGWLPYLKVRATYGYNGNVYNYGSAYLTGVFSTDTRTGARNIISARAPNPELSWERIRNINFGLDFATRENLVSGTVEWYAKYGKDLIQPTNLAPQTGFTQVMANTASTVTKGIDVNITAKLLQGNVKWNSTLLLSSVKDEIIKYDVPLTSTSVQTNGNVVGKPINGIFSYKWMGMDAETGDPLGLLNGQLSKDYTAIRNNFQPDSLVYSGTTNPTMYGAFRQDFSYRNWHLSFNITYQLGYVFRAPSVSLNYADLLSNGLHADYLLRWQQPGDELITNVPAISYISNSNRNIFYQYAEVLVEKGDHIRLQDVRLGYNFENKLQHLGVQNLQVFFYAKNLGILWRKNSKGLDPQAISYRQLPDPMYCSIGLSFNL